MTAQFNALPRSNRLDSSITVSRRGALLWLAGSVAGLAGCGGAGLGLDLAGITSGGTGSFTRGTITGFGSVIVNGVRYDLESTEVFEAGKIPRSGADLALGMVIDIIGSARVPAQKAGQAARAMAYKISYDSEWIGPISAIETTGGLTRLTLLGQTVELSSTTILAGLATQVSALAPGHFLSVYGYVDAEAGLIRATRIESSIARPDTFRLTGAIRAIDRSARTALLGATPIAWVSDEAAPESSIENESLVRVRLTNDDSGPFLTAIDFVSLDQPVLELPERDDEGDIEIHGTVSRLGSSSAFWVNGLPIRMRSADRPPDGRLVQGVAVEVTGRLLDGVLEASRVEFKTRERLESKTFEFYGYPEQVTPDGFVLRGVSFATDASTTGRSVLMQSPSPYIEIKARLNDGRWHAIEIEIED